ncbi:probable cation-transporting ATPase 13A3 [Trichonephila clavipes]|nr:probable cation-transporting ATPase 13A3 [Trichonephila clavipes]
MLTGESTPITKLPISEDSCASFDVQTNKRSILSCGTEVLLCRSAHTDGVRAVVYRTGTVPVIYTAVISIQLKVYIGEALLFVLNVVTFFVPPSLPAVLTSINEQAQRRLRKQGIFCLNSRYINFAGGLDVVCFDKTGTLTEDDLDILAAVPVRNQKFESAVLNLDQISEEVIRAMATCHSLARINGEVRGYNLDLKMFKLTGWGLQEPTLGSDTAFDYIPPRIVSGKSSSDKEEWIAIVKMFPFESSLKRMSVVTQTQGSCHFDVVMKGAPELVTTLCRKETVPDDVLEVLAYYSSQGFRVIALALKHLTKDASWKEVQKLTRDYLENDLEFLGLVVLENKLKPETIPALDTLKNADIRSVMVTGDNLLTAITVSKKCGMIEERDSVVIIKAELVSNLKSTFKHMLQVSYKHANFPILKENRVLKDMILEKSNENFDDTYVPIEEQCHVAMDGETFNLIRQYDSELLKKSGFSPGREVGITFQEGDRFKSCQVIYSQLGLAIHQNDHQARRRFVEWAQNEIAVIPDFHKRKRFLFSDEAHFWLNGYVSKQNGRIWSEANPQVYVETPLHPEKLTVWCALWAGGIIGPYFKNDEGQNVTVNGDRYRAMMTNFFIPELNNHDVQELWFQQDGATCHTARATIYLLKDTFDDRLISRFGPVNWPQRSCDLTQLDYFLWGYVKSLVYADKPQTLDHLEDNIRRVIADIRPQMLEKVIENWMSILDYIRASRGSHMPEIIFKM